MGDFFVVFGGGSGWIVVFGVFEVVFGGFWWGCGDFVGEKFCHIGKSCYFCNRK